jgi:hypothetical protein
VVSGAIPRGLGRQTWIISITANVIGWTTAIAVSVLAGDGLVGIPALWIASSLVVALWLRSDPIRVFLAKVPSLLMSGMLNFGVFWIFAAMLL